jgi:hypothetical protein
LIMFFLSGWMITIPQAAKFVAIIRRYGDDKMFCRQKGQVKPPNTMVR